MICWFFQLLQAELLGSKKLSWLLWPEHLFTSLSASVVAWPVALFYPLKPPRCDQMHSTLKWGLSWMWDLCDLSVEHNSRHYFGQFELVHFLCCFNSVSFGIEVSLILFEFLISNLNLKCYLVFIVQCLFNRRKFW